MEHCISCGAERAKGSMMCAECLETASKCGACGVALVDHMGHQGQCAELQQAKARIADLEKALNTIYDVCLLANATGELGPWFDHRDMELMKNALLKTEGDQ